MTPAHVHQTLLTMLPVLCADFSLHPPPSLMPPKKYCDITGLEAPYRDPHTGLQYHSREVYEVLKTLVCPEYLPVAMVGFGLTPACFSCSAARGRPAVPRDPRQGLDDQVRRSNSVLIASRYRSYRHASCYVALSAPSPRIRTARHACTSRSPTVANGRQGDRTPAQGLALRRRPPKRVRARSLAL
jgi:hypothetical protein